MYQKIAPQFSRFREYIAPGFSAASARRQRRHRIVRQLVAPRSTPTMPANTQQVSKKRKFVADGVFRAELDEFLRRELGEDGYAG